MKRLSIALAALLIVTCSYGQGTIYFNTRVAGVVDAPVVFPGGTPPGPDYSAQLFEVRPGGSLSPLLPATNFRSGSVANQKYVTPVDAVVVPDVAPGGSVTVVVGVWKTSLGSFEGAKAASLYGISAPVTVDNLGGGPLPPANLIGANGALQGFTFIFPEPSTIALSVLGASVLLLRRRNC